MDMKMKVVSVAVALSGLAFAASEKCAEGQWARPDLVAKVASGEVCEAEVSWWGFDQKDSTRYIQAALDSKARKIVLDKRESSWITRPLVGRSNLTLVIPEGVELCAKRGEYRNTHDMMLMFTAATNLTFTGGGTMKMWFEDYTNSTLYAWSEWRHALAFHSCSDVLVENLRIVDSGGDGIYLGRKGKIYTNTDVTIRNVFLSRNNRQGISVISADRLLIENCVMENTCGTLPMAGIDFEPNSPQEMLRNIVVRNCTVRGNRGSGFDFSVANLNSSSPEISVLIENCRSEGNHNPLKFHRATDAITRFRGAVEFKNCVFNDVNRTWDAFRSKSRLTMSVKFTGCFAAEPDRGERLIPMGADCGWGRVEVPTWPDGKPFKLEATPLPDLTKDRVTDASPGVPVRLNPIYIRNHVQYFLYADSARKINLKALVQPVGGSKFEYCKFRLYTLDGKLIGMVSLKQEFRKEQPISFDVPERGFYKLLGMVVKSHAMTLVESDVPVALVASSFYGLPGWSTLPGGGYIAVPEGSRRFAVLAQGSSGDEMVRARLFDPEGKCVWDEDNVKRSKLWYSPEKPRVGIWKLEALKATKGFMDDYKFAFFGIPYQLFLSKEKYWQR